MLICLQKACLSLLVLACPNKTNVCPVQAELLYRYVYAVYHVDGLVQERHNTNALAMELVFLALTHQNMLSFINRGQFWPSGIVVICVCVCVSVNHELVYAITNQPFKLESPNLDQRCKRPWLRSLLFLGD